MIAWPYFLLKGEVIRQFLTPIPEALFNDKPNGTRISSAPVTSVKSNLCVWKTGALWYDPLVLFRFETG